MRFLLRSILSREGHTVLEAEHGRAALACFAAADVALLVTDLEMPVMDGLELLRALKSWPHLPKLVVSGCSTEPPLERLGVSGFFCKPLELARFKSTVHTLLEQTSRPG